MTEEQIEKIIELLADYEKSSILVSVFVSIFACLVVIDLVLWVIKIKKIKKWKVEHYLTLTEEQKKAIKEQREIEKL